MEFEDFIQPEVGIAAAVAAALFSPRARNVMRRGLVYGTAGVLMAGDTIMSLTKNVGQNVQQMRTSNETTGQGTAPATSEGQPKEGTEQ